MKTNSILASIFVMKTRTRFERVNLLLTVDGHESKAEIVSVTDLLMQGLFSHEG
jgi:hypothetical protein